MRTRSGIGRRLAAALGLWAAAACAPRATTGEAGWGYEGDTGPEAWSRLSPEYALCEAGAEQSPVDLAGAVPRPLPGPEFRYGAAPLELAHLGHTLQARLPPGGTLEVDGETFELVQYHFHTPSEHRVRGESFPMEVHLVHRGPGGALAVVGVLIEEGRENAALRAALASPPAAPGEAFRDPSPTRHAEALLPEERANFRYPGSLTTPPCSEGVRWIVMAEPIEMSAAQIRAVRDLLRASSRPVRPIGERTILLDPAG